MRNCLRSPRFASLGANILVASLLLCASPTAAAQDGAPTAPQAGAAPRQLIRPGHMTGWETPDRPSQGWTVDRERLIGGLESKPLVSNWTFGDFTLELAWRARRGGLSPADGRLQVRFEKLPDRKDSIIVTLDESKQCGRTISGDQELFGGRPVAPMKDGYHRTEIVRHRERIRITIDGETVADFEMPTLNEQQRFGLSLHVPQGVVEVKHVTLTEPLGERIFNGQDLTGWWSQRKKDGWKVEDGMLVAQRKGGNYLRSEREFGDFTLNFDYKISKGGNSGVGIRTPRQGWPSRNGMELQILDRPGKSKGSQMAVYKHFPPLERPDNSGAWNNVVIQADGRLITAWVNGEIAQHADTSTLPATADKPLSGWLGFQDHGAKIQIKNVYVLEAP